MNFTIFVMYTDINGQSYKLEGDKAIIQRNEYSVKIEIFPTITVEDKTYEVMFPDDCEYLFYNYSLEEFTLHKLLHPTTNIKSCRYMFYYCYSLKSLDLSNLNTDNVVDMTSMFNRCSKLEKLNISNFNCKNAVYISYMFDECYYINQVDLSTFNENIIDDYTNIAKYIILANYNYYNCYYSEYDSVYIHDINCNNKYDSSVSVLSLHDNYDSRVSVKALYDK